VGAPGVAAPVAYAAAPAAVAAYARAVPYNIPPFAAALNVQTRGLAAPLLAPAAYAAGPVGPIAGPVIGPAAYAAAPAAYAAGPIGPIAGPVIGPAAYAAAPAAYAAGPAGFAPAYTVRIVYSGVSNGIMGFIEGGSSIN
jgi:hypothetical protein